VRRAAAPLCDLCVSLWPLWFKHRFVRIVGAGFVGLFVLRSSAAPPSGLGLRAIRPGVLAALVRARPQQRACGRCDVGRRMSDWRTSAGLWYRARRDRQARPRAGAYAP